MLLRFLGSIKPTSVMRTPCSLFERKMIIYKNITKTFVIAPESAAPITPQLSTTVMV